MPQPIKHIFDTFPLRTYEKGLKGTRDLALERQITARTFPYQGFTRASRFSLAVGDVYYDDGLGVFLASDPESMFMQLLLCSRNKVHLPKTNEAHDGRPAVIVVSCRAALDGNLPVLIEDTDLEASRKDGRRYILDYASLKAQVRDTLENNLLAAAHYRVLDTIVYDAYVATQANVPFTRNGFHLRNPKLASLTRGSSEFSQLASILVVRAVRVLHALSNVQLTAPELELKAAAYVLAITHNGGSSEMISACEPLLPRARQAVAHLR